MFLKNFDYTSPSLTLYYNSKRSHVSIFGGILTILSYIFCVIISGYFLSEVIFRKNPGIFFYNRVVTDAGTFPLNSKSMFHYIYIKNVDADVLSKYIQIIGFRNLYVTTYNNIGDRENYDHYIYERCKLDLDDLSYNNIKDVLNYTEYNLSFCLTSFYNKTNNKIISVKDKNFPIPSVEHGMSNPLATYYGVFIQKCHNSTFFNNNSCPSQIEIDNYVHNNNMSVGFSIINYEVIVENFEKPFKLSMNKITNGILNNAFTVNHLNFQPLSVISHNGFFLDKKKEGNYYAFDQNEKNTLDTETGILSSFYIWMQNKKQIYERTYKKVQNVMGDIGGSIKILITLTSWLNYLNYKHTVFLDINKIMNLYYLFCDKNNLNNKNHFISLNLKESIIYKSNNIHNLMENSNLSLDKSNRVIINNNHNNKINNDNINKENKNLSNYYFKQYSRKNNILIELLNLQEEFNENKNHLKVTKNEKENKIIFYDKINIFKFLYWYLKLNRKNNKNNNYLLYIKKYYQKIISEEELFYLYFDINNIKSIIQKVKSTKFSINNFEDSWNKKIAGSSNQINHKSLFTINNKNLKNEEIKKNFN